MEISRKTESFPVQEISWEEFIEVTGALPEHLQELIALGWIEASAPEPPAVFHDSDVLRVRKLERIIGDFDLPVIGGTIIVDLLERIDRLETLVSQLQNLENEDL